MEINWVPGTVIFFNSLCNVKATNASATYSQSSRAELIGFPMTTRMPFLCTQDRLLTCGRQPMITWQTQFSNKPGSLWKDPSGPFLGMQLSNKNFPCSWTPHHLNYISLSQWAPKKYVWVEISITYILSQSMCLGPPLQLLAFGWEYFREKQSLVPW